MHLISYDIEHDGLRVKIAKALIQYGLHRVQYSVFMGEVNDTALARINRELARLSSRPEWSPADTIMILPLHQYSEENVQFLGPSPSRWGEITGEIHTLVL
jgi:CRISPR-associated endonuclease Cas2